MRIEIHIELDEAQHTQEQIDEIARSAEFVVTMAMDQIKSNQRPRRDFDCEVHAVYSS